MDMFYKGKFVMLLFTYLSYSLIQFIMLSLFFLFIKHDKEGQFYFLCTTASTICLSFPSAVFSLITLNILLFFHIIILNLALEAKIIAT